MKYALLILATTLSWLDAQIAGSNSKSAIIYQDIIPSGLTQVLNYDSGTDAGGSASAPPPASYGISSSSGTLSTSVAAPPGQIIRWQLWGERMLPDQWYQLDVKALLPIQESMSLTSLDAFNPVRTRVGKGYSISISIAGMPSYGSGATQTGEVYLGLSALVNGTTYGFRSLPGYSSASLLNPNDPSNPGSLQQYQYNAWFLVNGSYSVPGLIPTQPGTETWLIDWIQTAEWSSSEVDQAAMLVLPAPTVTANRPIDSTFNGDPDSLPILDLAFQNLYPGSLTAFQIMDFNQNPIATLTVSDDSNNGNVNATHNVPHFQVSLSRYITQPGQYFFQAWTAEPFPNGLPTVSGLTAPPGYTWSPLNLLGTSTINIQFNARISGTIITN